MPLALTEDGQLLVPCPLLLDVVGALDLLHVGRAVVVDDLLRLARGRRQARGCLGRLAQRLHRLPRCRLAPVRALGFLRQLGRKLRSLLLQGALMRGCLLPELTLQLLHGAAVLRLQVREVRRELAPRQALLLSRLLHAGFHGLVVMACLLPRLEFGHLISVLREREGVPELQGRAFGQLDLVVLLDGLHDVFVLGDFEPESCVDGHFLMAALFPLACGFS